MLDKYKYIVFEGNIGAGKTSLASMVSRQHNAKLLLEEFEDNSFLPAFYKDSERNAFPLELSFLADRYHQLKKADFESLTVADYHIMKSLAFAETTLSQDEHELFIRMYEIINWKVKKPDLMVFLKWNVQALRSNIAKRGRSYERDISMEYLEKVELNYMKMLEGITEFPVLMVDCNGLDFVGDANDYRKIVSLFDEHHEDGVKMVEL